MKIVNRIKQAWRALRSSGWGYLTYPFTGPPPDTTVVSPDVALTYSAVWCANKLICDGVSRLPLNVIRSTDSGSVIDREHPLHYLLHSRPNPYMTSLVWRSTSQLHLGTHGNAYSVIVRDGFLRVVELWPKHPDTVKVEVGTDGNLRYYVSSDRKWYAASDILHIRGLSQDGILGLSPIEQARRSLSIPIQSERATEQLYKNDATPGGVLEHPSTMSPEARAQLRKEWHEIHGGSANKGQTAILWEGMQYKQMSLTPENAQFLESRKFGVVDVARWYNVPPALMHDMEFSADRANYETTTLNFLVFSLEPHHINWETQMEFDLLDESDIRAGVGIKFNTNAFQRADYKTRMDGYWVGRQAGIYSIDDLNKLEDKPAVGGEVGRSLLIPGNHLPVDPENPNALSDMTTAEPEIPTQPDLSLLIDDEEDDDNVDAA